MADNRYIDFLNKLINETKEKELKKRKSIGNISIPISRFMKG